MPPKKLDRGNDIEAADAEVRGTIGEYPDAEALLAEEYLSPEVRAASLKAPNQAATEELDLSEIDVPDGHEVLAATVRGDSIVYVATDETGRSYKGAEPYKGDKKSTSYAGVKQSEKNEE